MTLLYTPNPGRNRPDRPGRIRIRLKETIVIMKNLWKTREPEERLRKVLSGSLGVTPVLAQLLVNRGIRTPAAAQNFLFGALDACHDPFQMKDMDKAVKRLREALNRGEKILVYGDYDVDGVTSTALMKDALTLLGGKVETFIPNRLEEGYGLNIRAVAKAREDGVQLIITVDCGINSVKEVVCAKDHGIDVIITDHHEVKTGQLPPACAAVDPHRPDCSYPFSFLAGVGVAYKLVEALFGNDSYDVRRYLDLVALGTIADVAPLVGENRILAKAGLKLLGQARRPGLKALMEVARVDPEKLKCRHVGFVLGPRINAMGRTGSADVALELMLCGDPAEAAALAGQLDAENRNRRNIEKEISKEAMSMASEVDDGDKVIVLAGQGWHPGV
ncbi:MAG: single-stranded-DNA-specific exonuclease RecJ, partial [Candidatus Omnitrophica bacterium]|nr:single-stranded-DNA-specific exonuclease RecJ [Candidatus Omnitrophota bacterium]